MKLNFKRSIIMFVLLLLCFTMAEMRTYRQFKDVAIQENGKVIQSNKQGNLFELTFLIDLANHTITRTNVRRLDEAVGRKDNKLYKIIQKKEVWGSPVGHGGKVIIAVDDREGELLELSHRFAYTMRTSPFSQVITGVYKRVPAPNETHKKCNKNKPDKFAPQKIR